MNGSVYPSATRARTRSPRRSSIWYRGELVKAVTKHSALKGGVETWAHLYDLQCGCALDIADCDTVAFITTR